MKKKRIIGISLLVTAALLVITTGVVFAVNNLHGIPPFHSDDEINNDDQYFYSPMGGYGRHMWLGSEDNSMMALMFDAVAEETGLTVEDIEDRLYDGESLYEIALDSGMSEEAYSDLMVGVREAYLSEALANGLITEEQYDWMTDHMSDSPFEIHEGYDHCPYYQDGDSTYEGRPFRGMGMH